MTYGSIRQSASKEAMTRLRQRITSANTMRSNDLNRGQGICNPIFNIHTTNHHKYIISLTKADLIVIDLLGLKIY